MSYNDYNNDNNDNDNDNDNDQNNNNEIDYNNNEINYNNNQFGENNFNEKPLHGNQINSINIQPSRNSIDNEKINISNTCFSFLQSNGKILTFNLDEIPEFDIYQNFHCKYAICILIKDDIYFNSKLLEKTFEGIKDNIRDLKQRLINPENILICIFFNEIKNNSIFNEEEINSLDNNKNYILAQKIYYIEEQYINVHCIAKKNYLSDIESLKVFYTFIINKLKIDNNDIFSSIITSGVVPYSKTLLNLINVSYKNKSIVIPSLEDQNNNNIISKIKKYERFHFNLYNMNFYNMTASSPIISLLNTMLINNELAQDLYNYYSNIDLHQSIDFHDYNLSLYLFIRNYKINYNSLPMGYIVYSELTEDPICDYKDSWVRRYSGYYANFFQIINIFFNCNAFNFGQKILLFFQIIGLMVEFIFPSLSTMVIYTIFYEAFNIYDKRLATFFTLLYLFIFICSGITSLISNNSQRMRLSNLFFFIFMEIYYLFILINSIIAMDNVKKNKNADPYKFNTAAITCIIIFTFIPAISPMILKKDRIFENIVPMLLYLFLGAPSSSSNFYIAKILNACEASGGENIKERKGITIIGYCLVNLFFGSLTFYNYNRQKRVDSIMGLGIFYLIYNFFKMLAIIISIMTSKKINDDFIINEEMKNNLKGSSVNYSINKINNKSNNDYERNNQNYNQEYNQEFNTEINQEYPSKSQIENNMNNNQDNYDNNNIDNY